MSIQTKATGKESTIDLDSFDRALGRMIDLNLAIDKDPGEVNKDLAADAFWECFKPEAQAVENIPEGRELNRTLLDWLKSSQTWQSEHNLTSGSIFTSALAAGLLYQGLTQDDVIAAALKKQEEAEKARKEAEAAQAAADALQKAGQEKAAAAMQARADDQNKKASDLQGQAQAAIEKYTGSEQGQGAKGLINQKAKEETQKAVDTMTGWGSDPATVAPGDVKEVLDSLKNIQSKGRTLEQITTLMGRVKGLSMKTRSKKTRHTGTIVKDGYTQDLTHVFPGELALLRPDVHPLLRAQKMGEYADRGLIGMIEGTEASGSMQSGSPSRIVKAKALALGIAQAGHANGQEYKVFSFSGGFSYNQTGNATAIGASVDSSQDWIKHIDWASSFMGGGTNYDAALNHAMDVLETLSEPENADIVLITDGEAGIDEGTKRRFAEVKERLGTRLIGLMVGSDIAGRYDDLPNMAAALLKMDDFENLDGITEKLTTALDRQP
jgi:hypothetical protein